MVHEMLFKDISYLQLWQQFCLTEQNHLCNFDRRNYEEHFCEIILNLDQWFRMRYHLDYNLSTALVAILFGGVEPFRQF